MYLGIDLGTSELKLALLSDRHDVVATEGQPLTISRPHPSWSEQQPADWWAALDLGMQRLASVHPAAMGAVRAIGLSGQMHGAVLLDAAGVVLRPAILWNDVRSAAECLALTQAAPQLHRIAGNLAMPGFTAPKLLWVRAHEPAIFERTATVLLPKDWLRYRMTGERITDCSDASGTLWLDVAARQWSGELLAACGMSVTQMPQLREGSDVGGTLDAGIARRWGLSPGIAVAAGGGDNAASAVGLGTISPGQGFVSLGTSGVIFVCTDRFLPTPDTAVHAFCHALPGRWHQMSVMLSAASALRWAAQLTGQSNEAALLDRAAALSAADRERAPIFLPYLGGERTPHNDAKARGVLFGLTHEHGPGAVAHAVVEGVSFGLLDGFMALDANVQESVRELDLVGGGSRSAHWAQLLASVIGRPLVLRAGAHAGAALGAARLAWLADGGEEMDVCRQAEIQRRFEPDLELAASLHERHSRYRALYKAVSPHWTLSSG